MCIFVVLVIIAYHWSSLIIIGYHWLSLVIGYHWISLVIIITPARHSFVSSRSKGLATPLMDKKIPEPCGQMRRLFVARAALTGGCRENEEPFSDEVVIGIFVDKKSALGPAGRWLKFATWHTYEMDDTNIEVWKNPDELDDNIMSEKEVIIKIEDFSGYGAVIVLDSFYINLEHKNELVSAEEHQEEYEKELGGFFKLHRDEMKKDISVKLANKKKEEEEEKAVARNEVKEAQLGVLKWRRDEMEKDIRIHLANEIKEEEEAVARKAVKEAQLGVLKRRRDEMEKDIRVHLANEIKEEEEAVACNAVKEV